MKHSDRLTMAHCVQIRLIGIGILLSLAGCGYDGPLMSVHELKAAMENPERNITIIDVRPKATFEEGHVKGAINFPLKDIDAVAVEIGKSDGEVAIICTCGRLSLKAIRKLSEKGIKTTLVEGGMKKWTAAKYNVVKGK